MLVNQWRIAAFLPLTLVLIAAGMATATDEAAPVDQPQAAAEAPVAVAQPDQATQPAAVDEPEAQPEVTAVIDEEATSVRPPLLMPPAPPPSLQTLVDQRRDQLRERREALFDAFRPYSTYMSPWTARYDRTMDLYRDAARQLHRDQRDYSRHYFDSWMDAMCPWSKPQRDWTRMRSYLRQQEQLDRQEVRDAWLAPRRYTYAGLMPW